jgi:hypothetical protein
MGQCLKITTREILDPISIKKLVLTNLMLKDEME